ncbi:UNVERIFIED_CONTAM: hypothetical protein GTU68_059706 [Idotea baltica]|nr:hypothetical protein [Idotea baltica]
MITGCSRGLGRAMTHGFIERGDTVVGCARNETAIGELNATFESEPHHFEVADIAIDTQVESFCHTVMAKLGPPDLLINAAALVNANAKLWEVSAKEFSDVIDVNLKGTANLIRHITPAMIKRGSGVIVNFSSYWGRSTSPDVAPYCATKWGVEGLTSALAQELPNGLAAVAFNPGIIDTEMLRSCFGEGAGSYGTPEEWAKAAVPYLANLGPGDNGASVTCPGQ